MNIVVQYKYDYMEKLLGSHLFSRGRDLLAQRSLTGSRSGFTLVEIAIVLIIIGLLIGGTFGGMKLIENMQVNKTVQDLKAIESAALTFKDTYGRLPGDMPNAAARLPSCTSAPCSTGGNGNRIIGAESLYSGAIVAMDENFTFWHHLQAANLLSMGFRNTTDMAAGEGQPDSALDAVFRISDWNIGVGALNVQFQRTALVLSKFESADTAGINGVECTALNAMDVKVDDGNCDSGRLIMAWGCTGAGPAGGRPYATSGTGSPLYDLKGF